MKRIAQLLLIFCLPAVLPMPEARAQEAAGSYTPVPVTVSKQKVKDSEGKVYYSHVVLERQTLFSISHAYGVTVRDILEANPSILGPEDLKKHAIILIPDLAANERKAKKDRKRQKTESEPLVEATAAPAENVASVPADSVRQPAADTTSARPIGFDGLFPGTAQWQEEKPARPGDRVKAILMLPFKVRGKGGISRNNFDFYAGALLAIKELGEEGIGTDLSVYDISDGLNAVPEKQLKETELVMGPIHADDVKAALAVTPSETPLISPLSHETAALVRDHPGLVQMAPSYFFQYRDLIRWVREDLQSGDQVLLVTEKTARDNDAGARISELAASSGMEYKTLSYSILEGRSITTSFERLTEREGTVRVVLGSDNEGFTADVLRNLNVLSHRGREIVLYAPSRIRSFETIETGILHSLNLHMSLAYFVDYDQKDVQRFILSYRALYNAEPTPFSFQGYDMARYFLRRGAVQGASATSLPEEEATEGLQTNFHFVRSGETGGYVNTAVRRIRYKPDYSIERVR